MTTRLCVEMFVRRGYLPDWRKCGLVGSGWHDPEDRWRGAWLRIGTRFLSIYFYDWAPDYTGERPPPIFVRSVPWRLFVEAGVERTRL